MKKAVTPAKAGAHCLRLLLWIPARHTTGRAVRLVLWWTAFAGMTTYGVYAADSTSDLQKISAMDAGKMSPTEKKLFRESISATKESMARDALEVFYLDAKEYYRNGNYDGAMELLDKIYSVDPTYADVASLRRAVRREQESKSRAGTREQVSGLMRKGSEAAEAGNWTEAIAQWQKALELNPKYAPAQRKIDEANRVLGQKDLDEGNRLYGLGKPEEALKFWSSAMARDPELRKGDLLARVSRVQLEVSGSNVQTQTQLGQQRYAARDLEGALHHYEAALKLDPRHREARRMSAKITIELGRQAFQRASSAMESGRFDEAVSQWEAAIRYRYESKRAQDGIEEARRRKVEASRPKPKPKPKPAPTEPEDSAPAEAPSAPTANANPEEALKHYRAGLAAMKADDFHRAMQELDLAVQMDPSNQRILIARERARQAWEASRQHEGGTPAP